MCPAYILPHWQEFKNKVKEKLNIKDSSPIVALGSQNFKGNS